MDQARLMISKADLLDGHFRLHTQDFVYRPRLSPGPGLRKGVVSGVLSGLVIGVCVFGAVWFELWK